jgi:hypothetical protein
MIIVQEARASHNGPERRPAPAGDLAGEGTGGQGGEKPGCQQQREPRAERDDDVTDGEDRQRERQGQPPRQPQGQDRHSRGADDHSDREDGDQQAGARRTRRGSARSAAAGRR